MFVRGEPAISDQATLDRLPTLMNADLVDREGEQIGFLADLAFDPSTGTIAHYLVSRSDPRLPGSSRWQLVPYRITDQRPGQVMTALRSLDDLPLMRASVRQDLLQRTQRWRDQLRDMGDRAGDRLEGWLDEPPWDESEQPIDSNGSDQEPPGTEVWDDDTWPESSPKRRLKRDEDPWV